MTTTIVLDPATVEQLAATHGVEVTTGFAPVGDDYVEPLTAEEIHRAAAKLAEIEDDLAGEEIAAIPVATVIRDGKEHMLTFDQLDTSDDVARALAATAAEAAALQRKLTEVGFTFMGLLRLQRANNTK